MKNKTTTYKWAYLPFVFSSAAILATQATAGPSGSQRYQDARQVNSINHEYVGGTSQIGVGIDDEGNVDAEFNQVISESDNHSTGVGLWAGYDLKGDDKGILGRGGQVNHAWVSRDASGRATHVNKTFAAYDRNEAGHDKATVGYGQENENLFWDGRVSKGLSGGKDKRTVNGNVVTDRAYDWGIGATVGKFLPNANARIRAGVDHEWSNKVGSGEKNARNTTLSAGIEKFFQGTGHSLSLDVAGSKNSGGYRFDGQDDTDVTGRLGYKYDFGGSSIYQPDRRYRRVRVEVPGQAVAPRYAQKQQYKKVPTYKTVPVYGNKTVSTPYKQLVKSTMELEGQTFFKLNSAKLIPSAQTRLKQIASQIRKTGYKGSIRITGNTCGLGDARYDQILSEKRAKEVRNFLIKNGFNPNHLIARGLGKGHPKYPRTPDQDFKNRRVDIEYVSQQQAYKTGHKSETKRVQTGTRRVATGFKNVPAGMKNVMISNGRPGAPRVIWKTEAIPTSPAWIKRALHNNIQHDRGVNTYTTTFGNEGPRTPENTGPVANNDSTKTECGSPVSINVLGNDTDADGDALTITSFTQPANGTVTRGANGTLIYTPNAGAACGIDDSFDYTISDGNGGTSTATVTVSIDAANTAPVAVDDSATTTVGQSVTLDTIANDSDADGDALTITNVSDPANGTAVINGGQIVYTPDDDFVGTDTFTYTISDGNGGTATATETVVVNGPDNVAPAAQDDSATTSEGTAVTLSVLNNDTTNSGSDQLTITSVGTPQRGTAVISGGQIVYTPNAGFVGTDSFTYTITDSNGATATATATVVVSAPANVNPVAQNDSATTPQGDAVSLDVTSNDTTNSGSGVKTITSFGQPANTADGVVTLLGNNLVFTPSDNFVGVTTFNYTITDSNGATATANATVTVVAMVVDPKAKDDPIVTQCDAVTIDLTDNDIGDNLSIVSVDAGALMLGTVTQNGNSITFKPYGCGIKDAGSESFTYTITDGNSNTANSTANVNVTVEVDEKAGNQAYAVFDQVMMETGEETTINVLLNDDGEGLKIIKITQPKIGYAKIVKNEIFYKAAEGESYMEEFNYTIQDKYGKISVGTIMIDALKGCTAVGTKCN